MQITEIFLKNFRSFGPQLTCITLENFTALIGANSSGKTALVHALLRMFGTNPKDRSLTRGDFHLPLHSSLEEIGMDKELSIEVKIEFPHLTSEQGKNSVPSFFNQMIIDVPNGKPYLRIRLEGKWTQGSSIEGEIDQKLYYIRVPYGTDETDAYSPVQSHERALIQMIYVPAVREPSEQLRNASGTLLWRLLDSIEWPEKIDESIQEKMIEVDALFSGIEGVQEVKAAIQKEWGNFHQDYRYRNAEISFNSTTLSSILKKIEVQFSPTVDPAHYTVDKLGDGLRSLFYLSLVSSLLNVEEKMGQLGKGFKKKKVPTALTILAVEEPENHIAPHLLGKVMRNLRDIAMKSNAQSILTSHSASIVKRVDPIEIRYTRINEYGCTVVKNILLPEKKDEAHKYVKEAVKAYPELYFAKLVILGEGDSEEIILPKLMEEEGVFPDNAGVSIVPLGGRHVNHFWRLLDQLQIPHITLLDLDLGRGGGGWGRIKYSLEQLLLMNYVERDKLLLLNDGSILTDEALAQMHTWDFDKSIMGAWMDDLENYNVFFSKPLDIDFLMLEAFLEIYQDVSERGPKHEDKEKGSDEFKKTYENGIVSTLKKKEYETGLGEEFYTLQQLEKMMWYKTLFLGRGKPVTHLEALANLNAGELSTGCPQPLKDLMEKIKLMIGGEIKESEG